MARSWTAGIGASRRGIAWNGRAACGGRAALTCGPLNMRNSTYGILKQGGSAYRQGITEKGPRGGAGACPHPPGAGLSDRRRPRTVFRGGPGRVRPAGDSRGSQARGAAERVGGHEAGHQGSRTLPRWSAHRFPRRGVVKRHLTDSLGRDQITNFAAGGLA